MQWLLAWFSKAAGVPMDMVEEVIDRGGDADPELRPVADSLLAFLASEVNPEAIASALNALPGEMRDILRGQINPADHPSDFGG